MDGMGFSLMARDQIYKSEIWKQWNSMTEAERDIIISYAIDCPVPIMVIDDGAVVTWYLVHVGDYIFYVGI